MASCNSPATDRRTTSCPTISVAAKPQSSPNSSRNAPQGSKSPRSPQLQRERSVDNLLSSQHEQNDGGLLSPSASASPKTRAFLSSITERVRSRSRSLSCSRDRSASPAVAPPQNQLPDSTNIDSRTNLDRKADDSIYKVSSPIIRTSSPEPMNPQPPSPGPRKQRHSNSMPVRPSARSGSGTFTQCGRHSNEWLFNGFSVTETVKGVLERRSS